MPKFLIKILPKFGIFDYQSTHKQLTMDTNHSVESDKHPYLSQIKSARKNLRYQHKPH